MRFRVGYQHTKFSSILTRFVDYYSPFWGPEAISIVVEPQGALTCRSCRLAVWLILTRFMDYSLFWGPGMISTIDEPRGASPVSHQHSRFLPILTRFVDYYSPLWDPKSISMVVEPQAALTCRPSTLTVLVDSGPFHGLLLTIWGSGRHFQD